MTQAANNIVQLDVMPEEEARPWRTGQAHCLAIPCRHTWDACEPATVHKLECPRCRSMLGRWRDDDYRKD